jgi:glycosyltransferase involved in cell wall biosynthesis
MRIAYFTEVFLPKVDGVVTRLIYTLDQLRKLGHEALVFAPATPGESPPKTYLGHTVVPVPGVPFRPWYPEQILGLPRPRIGRELDRFGADIVHVVNPVVLGLWGTAIAKQRNLPLLASYHTDLASYAHHLRLSFLVRPGQAFLREVHNQAHVNLCTSTPILAAARNLGIKRVRLWPKAVDTNRFHPTNWSAGMRNNLTEGHPDDALMIYVGRLSNEKRVAWLLDPISRLKGVRLAVVGSGPAEPNLRKLFHGTHTVFTGYMGGTKLAEAYASADVFAFPSDTETLGFVALEAMASGVPVVGARAGGIPDVIQHRVNGLLFAPGDIDDLRTQLGLLLGNTSLRSQLGTQARNDTEAWSWQASTLRLLESYNLAKTVRRRFDPPSAL